MKNQEVLENIKVENFAAEGKSIAKVEGKVLFIEKVKVGE